MFEEELTSSSAELTGVVALASTMYRLIERRADIVEIECNPVIVPVDEQRRQSLTFSHSQSLRCTRNSARWSLGSSRAAVDIDSLEIEDLRVAYQGAEVIHGVSLSASTSEIVAIVGENGAGKSTVLRAITGFGRSETGRITGGSIRFRRQDVTRANARRTARLGLTLVQRRKRSLLGSL